MALQRNEMNAVARIQQAYQAKLAAIRADRDLSDAGKRKAMAAEYRQSQRLIAAVRDGSQQNAARRRAELEKKLFHLPGGQLEYREARAYAAKIKTPAEAQRELRNALRHGDASLAHAIFCNALDRAAEPLNRSWTVVADEYASKRADLRPIVDEYSDLLRGEDKAARAMDAMSCSVVKPAELHSVTDHEIDRLNAEAATPADRAPQQPPAASMHLDLPPGVTPG